MSHNASGNNINASSGMGLAALFIFFWGDPDIADAIIYYLMNVVGS